MTLAAVNFLRKTKFLLSADTMSRLKKGNEKEIKLQSQVLNLLRPFELKGKKEEEEVKRNSFSLVENYIKFCQKHYFRNPLNLSCSDFAVEIFFEYSFRTSGKTKFIQISHVHNKISFSKL